MSVTPFTEIPVNRSAPYGGPLLNAVLQLQTVIHQLSTLAAKSNTMVVDNGDGTHNYDQLEKQFGLTHTGDDTSSVGYSLQYQMNAVNTLLANGTIAQFLAQVG